MFFVALIDGFDCNSSNAEWKESGGRIERGDQWRGEAITKKTKDGTEHSGKGGSENNVPDGKEEEMQEEENGNVSLPSSCYSCGCGAADSCITNRHIFVFTNSVLGVGTHGEVKRARHLLSGMEVSPVPVRRCPETKVRCKPKKKKKKTDCVFAQVAIKFIQLDHQEICEDKAKWSEITGKMTPLASIAFSSQVTSD